MRLSGDLDKHIYYFFNKIIEWIICNIILSLSINVYHYLLIFCYMTHSSISKTCMNKSIEKIVLKHNK